MIGSYGSLRAIGHREVADIFKGQVVIQEKVDGSQISFRRNADGDLEARSKGAMLNIVAPDKMFSAGVTALLERLPNLNPSFVYRGEYLRSPKHNTLAYDRIPQGHVALFDIEDKSKGDGYYLTPDELAAEAARIGLDVVPTIYVGDVSGADFLRGLLERTSMLGGAKIEGVVVKNYAKFHPDGKPFMGKFVSEAFKEIHGGEWRKANPTRGDIIETLVESLRTPARYMKAMTHLRDDGKLTDSPKDIGGLIKEVGDDIQKECEDDIKAALFAHFWPQIRRQVTAGVPEWYKQYLLSRAFDTMDE